ncbi:MAG TPA: hypothetical protein VGR64_07210 [Terracidiphilus sp.]|nr:hypothetical protein [Terracidiphilus sp.]
MNNHRNVCLLVSATTLLFATAALAQNSSAKQAATKQDQHSGVATGRRIHQPLAAAAQPNTGTSSTPASGNAQAYYAKHRAKMGTAQSNPMYQEKKTSGTNPLFEAKDKTLQPPQPSGKSGAAVVEYKDGEDSTVRGKQASGRKSGSIIVVDRNASAKTPAKHDPAPATGTKARR